MTFNAAMFLFLAAAVVAVFAFCSIVVWVTTPSRERQARDRIALLKAVAENPGENARLVLELLRAEDERRGVESSVDRPRFARGRCRTRQKCVPDGFAVGG